MPPIDVKEDPTKRTLTITAAAGWQAQRQFTVAYATTEAAALGAAGLPPINSLHPASGYLYCQKLKIDSKSFNFWIVTADYAQVTNVSDQSNPLNQPTQVSVTVGNQSKAIDQDYDGNPILNTARLTFAKSPSRDFGTCTLTLIRNEPFYNFPNAVKYQNTLNRTPWSPLGLPALLPGQALCRSIVPTQSFTRNSKYVPVKYEFELRSGSPKVDDDGLYDGFKLVIMSQGKAGWYRDPNTGKPTIGAFCDKNGNPVNSDLVLNAQGVPIVPPGADPGCFKLLNTGGNTSDHFDPIPAPGPQPAAIYAVRPGDPSSPIQLKYHVYELADFGTFAFTR